MSNKMPLDWHRDRLKCVRQSLEREREELDRSIKNRQATISRLEGDIRFLEEQVAAAEKVGKDGFDEERFLVKRKEEKA